MTDDFWIGWIAATVAYVLIVLAAFAWERFWR